MKINVWLGVAGVNPLEAEKTKRIGRFFEFLVLIALFMVFAQLLMFYTDNGFQSAWITHAIWLVFLSELLVNLYHVRHKLRYVKENWLNVLIVIIALPVFDWGAEWAVIVRSLRLLLFVRFFTGFFRDIISVLNKNRFGQILVASSFVILGSGALFSYLEDRSFWDGVWYSLVTITTVGYGDVVPVSEYGRAFGVILILFGVVFFSLVTANISAFLIGSEQNKLERDILGYMKQTEKRLANQQSENEAHVERIIEHMSQEIEILKSELRNQSSNTSSTKEKHTSETKIDK